MTKPLFALASNIELVLLARLIDRLGKGIRGAPRDALVADIAPPPLRGAAFGLRQALDTIGALLGPVLAIGFMVLWADSFRAVFWMATFPAFMAVALLVWGVQETEDQRLNSSTLIRSVSFERLPSSYWWVVAIGALFSLARFSEAFLILRAQQEGIPLSLAPVVMISMNLVYACSAYPFGRLADTAHHPTLLAWGLIVLIGADLLLAMGGWGLVLLGAGFWGLHMGMTQGLLTTMIAHTAPGDLRGTAFGVFGLISGLAMFLASLLAGIVWDWYGGSYTFYGGAALSTLTLFTIFLASRVSKS